MAEAVGSIVLAALLELGRNICAAAQAVRDFPAQAQKMDQRCRGIGRHVQHIQTTPSLSALVGVVHPQLARLHDVFADVFTFLTELAATRRLRQTVRYRQYEQRFAALHNELDRAWQDLSNAISIRHSLALGEPPQHQQRHRQRPLHRRVAGGDHQRRVVAAANVDEEDAAMFPRLVPATTGLAVSNDRPPPPRRRQLDSAIVSASRSQAATTPSIFANSRRETIVLDNDDDHDVRDDDERQLFVAVCY
jgi:hypothetical protein